MKIKQELLDPAGIMCVTVFYNLPAMNSTFVFLPNWVINPGNALALAYLNYFRHH